MLPLLISELVVCLVLDLLDICKYIDGYCNLLLIDGK